MALTIVFFLLLNIINCVNADPTEIPKGEFRPLGFQSEISDVKIRETSKPVLVKSNNALINDEFPTQDINLKKMAYNSINYFVYNVRKELDYEARFAMSPLNFPPAPLGYDGSSLADTDVRMDTAFIYLRDIVGGKEGIEAQEGLRKRVLSYVRNDGFCWAPPYAVSVQMGSEPRILTFGTNRIMESLIETYVRTGSIETKFEAKKMADALRSLASWKDGMAWYPGGNAPKINSDWSGTQGTWYPQILVQLVRFWEVTGDLDSQLSMNDFTLANVQLLKKTGFPIIEKIRFKTKKVSPQPFRFSISLASFDRSVFLQGNYPFKFTVSNPMLSLMKRVYSLS